MAAPPHDDRSESPRQRRRRQTREALLDAAAELTEANGAAGWTMRDLAERIDYSTTATYRYFESKDQVLASLGDRTLEAMRDRLERAADASAERGDPPRDRLRAVAEAYLEVARADPTGFRLTFVDLPSRRTTLDEPAPQDSPYRVLLDVVTEGVEAGALRSHEGFGPDQIAVTVWGLVHGMAVLELTHLRSFAPELPSVAREGLERLLDGLGQPH